VHGVPDFFVFTAIIPRLLGAKVMLDIHDILPEFFCERFNKPLNSIYGKLLRVAEYLSVKFSNFVITGNDLWRDKISKRDSFSIRKDRRLYQLPAPEIFHGDQLSGTEQQPFHHLSGPPVTAPRHRCPD